MKRLATAICAALTVLAFAADAQLRPPAVQAIRLGADAERTRIVVDSDAPLDYFVFTLAEQGARVVIEFDTVDFQITGLPIGDGQRMGAGEGLVAGYRYADFSPTRSRIVLDLAAPATVMRDFQLSPDERTPHHRLVVDLTPADPARFRAGAGYPADRVAPEAPAAYPEDPARTDDRRVVVIDPGHGGRMPGAEGVSGTPEKEINLALSRAIRDRLEATGRYQVIMTRDDDTHVELIDRIRIARQAAADLFLSVHANAGGPNDRGASVWTLSDAAEGRTIREVLRDDPWLLDVDLAEREAEVNAILIDLAHRETRNQSTSFAEAVLASVGRVTRLLPNGHRHAGFQVLLAPDVPAALLEAGYMTNREEEALLRTAEHRGRLADAIVEGIDSYFSQRERLYAARGTR